jgi:hypothetical protein
MGNYQPVSTAYLLKFSKQDSDGPRCIHCGQRFQLSFRDGRVSQQRCGCGLVYRVESLGTLQFIEAGRPGSVACV